MPSKQRSTASKRTSKAKAKRKAKAPAKKTTRRKAATSEAPARTDPGKLARTKLAETRARYIMAWLARPHDEPAEVDDGEPEPLWEHTVNAMWKVLTGGGGKTTSNTRMRRLLVLAIHEAAAGRPSRIMHFISEEDAAIGIAACKRKKAPRPSSHDLRKWKALAAIVTRNGYGPIKHTTLKREWLEHGKPGAKGTG